MKYLLPLFLCSQLLAVDFNWYGFHAGIHTQTDWAPFQNTAEAAQGAARIRTGAPIVTTIDGYCLSTAADQPLPLIPVGSYRVYAIMYNYAYGTNVAAVFRAGGASGYGVFDPNDKDGGWHNFGVIDVPAAIDRVNFRVYFTNGFSSPVNGLWPTTVVAVYMTSDVNQTMTSDSYLQTWNLSTATDASAPIAGNYAYNSSFELPIAESGISIYSDEGKVSSIADAWKSGDAQHGGKYLSLPMKRCDKNLVTTTVNFPSTRMRPDKAHTISVWARCSATPATIQLALRNPVVIIPPGYGFPLQPQFQSTPASLTTTWQRYSLPNQIIRAYPYSDFSPELIAASTGGNTVEIDTVMVEEGVSAGTWTPAWNREIAVRSPKVGAIHYVDEGNPVLDFYVSENGTSASDTINYKVYYLPASQVVSSSFGTLTDSTQVVTNSVSIPVTKLGQYRVTAWLQSGGPTLETTFQLINRPRNLSIPDRKIGTDPQGAHWICQELDRFGVRQLRQLSPGTMYRWDLTEPTPGGYNWYDEAVFANSEYGFPTLANLYQTTPAWGFRHLLTFTNVVGSGYQVGEVVTQGAASGRVTWVSSPTGPLINAVQLTNVVGTFSTTGNIVGGTSGTTSIGKAINNRGSSFVNTVAIPNTVDIVRYAQWAGVIAARYTNVSHWEVWNEPAENYGTSIDGDNGMAFYAEHVIRCADSIKAANPAANVVGLGGQTMSGSTIINATKWWNHLPQATRDKLWGFSWHTYPDNSGFCQSLADWALARGKPGVNSEAGWKDVGGGRLGWQGPWYFEGIAVQAYQYNVLKSKSVVDTTRAVSTNVMSTLGSGLTDHYYYDCRNFHTAKNNEHHFTMLDGDDTFKPKAMVFPWAEYALGGGIGKGQALLTSAGTTHHTAAYVYEGGLDGKDWAMIYCDDKPRQLTWSLNSSQYEVYDIYGNRISVTGSVIPYGQAGVYVKGTGTTWSAMKTAINGATVAALTDTVAPTLVFQDIPENPMRALDKHYAAVRWIAFDDFSIPQSTTPEVLVYRWRLNGGAWSSWSQNTYLEYINPASGTYAIDVECRDQALNTSPTPLSGSFTVP